METRKVKINVNGADYEVDAGLNVLDACRGLGIEIPFFCYHPNLKVAGSCRMCLVTIGMPARDRATGELLKEADGSPKIAFMPKPAIACGTKVAENMHVITNSDAVKSCRESILEFILLNHPLDCPICDKAGECKLQEYANTYGNGKSRYVENKNVKPKKVEVAGKIMLDSERCIECSRCIRFCNEFIGKPVFGFTKRGSKTEISVYGDDNDSNYLLNVVDGCPVGALTEKAFRFQMRTWFLKTAKSICAESSAGVNTRVWSRDDKIYRITPRQNNAVNDMFMSDSGRYIYERFRPENRLSSPRIDSSPCDLSYAIDRAVEISKLGGLAIVANGWQTLEEQFMIATLAKSCGAKVHIVSHIGEDDGKLVSADRTPNMRGAFVAGLVSEYPAADFSALAEQIRSGEVKTVLCFREDIKSLGLDAKDFKLANIIYCGALENHTSESAKICIPLRTEFEKNGLWINRQFRVQRFERAVNPPAESVDEIELLSALARKIGNESFKTPSVAHIREIMAEQIPELKDCANVGDGGIVIDSSRFANIKFPETAALHFEPSK